MTKIAFQSCFLVLILLFSHFSLAGAQREETLSDNVASTMRRSVSNASPPKLVFRDPAEGRIWLKEMSRRLQHRIPDQWEREKILTAIQYESTRAGLDPQMVLGLIEVESAFRRYAVSSVGARGLMQVMPFWVRNIGSPEHNLFDLTTNLRYGCTILRHYMNIENGDVFRALGRYNGSLGKAKYPNAVVGAWKSRWHWDKNNPTKEATDW